MSDTAEDPRCPECGEPIGQTATYCMHCSADLTDERAAADADGDGTWDESNADQFWTSLVEAIRDAMGGESDEWGRDGTTDSDVDWSTGTDWNAESDQTTDDRRAEPNGPETNRQANDRRTHPSRRSDAPDEPLLDPDGTVDNTLTIAVGIVGGVVVGLVGTVVLGAVTGSAWAIPFGLLAWLGSTAYIARRRTVQGAISLTGYGTALVLLLVPVIALSPFADVDGGLAGRGSLLVILLVFVAVPASIAAAVGWIAARFRPDSPGT